MKKFKYLFILLLLVGIVSCRNRNNSNSEGSLLVLQDSTDVHGLQRMQVSKVDVALKFKGKEYHSFITRTPDESLPHVLSPSGDTYLDNKIELCLMRGGEQVFGKTFTKRDFALLVSEDFLSKAVLEGMVYNKTTPEGFVYAASVCYPQTDLYVPLSITLTPDGKMTIVKDELLEDVYEMDSI